MQLTPGQRWISNAEPELGLGTILRIEGRGVQVLYATSGVLRQYALHAAPLTRAEFRPGQKVQGKGLTLTVEQVQSEDGLLVYHGQGLRLAESELDDTQPISRADERLVSVRLDRSDRFDFRLDALQRRAAVLRSPAWGLASARVDLIPHQLRVAAAAAGRQPLRVLLADEVGLGKTIEAGMILSRLLAAGRAGRVLVLAPESLVHQWFVELLRRFNLQFALYDEERCEAIETGGDDRNPFGDEQLVIASIGFLADNAKRSAQAIEAGWDVVVVDEAHHLAWTPDAASAGYTLIETLAGRVPGLILLTATPEQLGRSGHFARLRLLDPARFHALDRYVAEADGYAELSAVAARLKDGDPLSDADRTVLQRRFGGDPELLALLDSGSDSDALLDALIDRHGTGRVMFRNRRAQIGGFPKRLPELQFLDATVLDDQGRQRLLAEFQADLQAADAGIEVSYADDPRLPWLIDRIENDAGEKLLLICRSQAKVLALEEALRTRSGVKVARFHEGMSLVQRDRNAAYFADPDGARVLLCSEIGSEGRNFQFARHLVLWDLPFDPDLLEQRIGRLDRIGQKHDIRIHLCVVRGSAQQALVRWYEEGLDAFRRSPADGRELLKRYGTRVAQAAIEHARGGEDADAELDALIAETRATHEELSAIVHAGRDRLLELASERDAHGEDLTEALAMLDADTGARDFILRLFEQFGVESEDQGGGLILLDPEYLSTDGFPGLKDGAQQATFQRPVALAREDIPLLRLDHPMVAGAVDLLLESEQGNAAFLVDTSLPARTALLECVFVLDCVADRRLGVDRFLPPLPIRVVVDSRLQERADFRPQADVRANERTLDPARYRPILGKLVPPLLAHAETRVREYSQVEIGAAVTAAEQRLGAEQARLTALARVNPAVRLEEIAAIGAELDALREAIPKAAARLDAVRLVCSPDFLALR
ncbi:RNA polymerase-associated protein RapA [Dokdonella koreensis]|uniref:RNA polymerase-associated protein RapA n=1 Tax=Dokdonella koreensis DS-123 TaxID=1300342 RepID=A0A160DU72_9GAMM|nr:RNA polymerase-associated protein RapA [Dokdonella koreensis]ANB17987.1 ATP-dependent helicase HepA [Dokdonella koreensis DS-123]